MSFPLETLKNLLAPKSENNVGIVSVVTPSTLGVATKNGLLFCSYEGVLRVGDRVAITGTTASKLAPIDSVYRV